MYKFIRRSFCETNKIFNEKDFLKMDYYSLLNCKYNSSEGEIRKNYFHLAKKYHPDKYKGSVDIFRKISDAYNTLKDPFKRDEYNKKMKIKARRFHKQNEKEEKTVSKYEEDFQKLNIDKLFFQFTSKKLKTSPSELKVYYIFI